MSMVKSIRTIGIALAGVALAIALGTVSAGIVYTKKAPQTALMLFPANGLAGETMASATFTYEVAQGRDIPDAASIAEEWARPAYLDEPLTPRTQTVLARAQGDKATTSQLVALASQLDKRDTMLQALVLQESVEKSDYPGVIRALDHILRVRPSRSLEMFKVLLPVFSQDGTVEEFARILDGSSGWHGTFIDFALNNPAALENLYRLRSLRPFEDEEHDRKLVEMLARNDKLFLASQLYRQLSAREGDETEKNQLPWTSEFPPFDWAFADEAGLRAQPSLGSTELEIYIRPGQGGVLASRVLEKPSGAFAVSLSHDIVPQDGYRTMRLVAKCLDSGQQIAETPFGVTNATLSVATMPPSCEFIELSIVGRAWTGQSIIRGELSPVEVR